MELPIARKTRVVLLAGVLVLGVTVLGCQPSGDQPVATPKAPADTATAPQPSTTPEPAPAKADEPATSEQTMPSAAQASKEGGKDAEPSAKPAAAGEAVAPENDDPGPFEAQMGSSSNAANDDPEPPRDLGPPLVDNPAKLVELLPSSPIWFDKEHKSVVLQGVVCQRRMTLELFACLKGSKEHESVISVPVQAYVVHAGLQATGANPGNPVQFYPEYIPARGTEIEITVIWKNDKGQIQRARAQDWIRNVATKKAMEQSWVFAGSHFVKDEQTGKQYYRADGEGDLICVSNFPSAVLDLPIKSTDQNASLLFECFTEHIPPIGTPVTLVLTPKPEKEAPKPPAK